VTLPFLPSILRRILTNGENGEYISLCIFVILAIFAIAFELDDGEIGDFFAIAKNFPDKCDNSLPLMKISYFM
jgi:hypothetical protein